VTNTLAYYAMATIMALTSFIVQAPEVLCFTNELAYFVLARHVPIISQSVR
jgi:hypothetical protein